MNEFEKQLQKIEAEAAKARKAFKKAERTCQILIGVVISAGMLAELLVTHFRF